MPIYIESRDLGAVGGFVAEHPYLVYIPGGQELNYGAWKRAVGWVLTHHLP